MTAIVAGARSAGEGSGGAGPGSAGRFAPSPTGELHLGNLRTAVLAWLFACASGRALLLRVEDLDTLRNRPGAAEQQRRDLATLGLTFAGEPLRQSTRLEVYAAALERLRDRTYECYCTRQEVAEASSAPHGAWRSYPGRCRELTGAQRAERRRSRPPALRLRADGAVETVHDLLHGSITAAVEDVVLRRIDGTPAYHLAVVVDDGDARIDQVVRGDDLLPVTPSQAHLAGLLGYPVPTYAHVPLAVNTEGRRLAKRDGAVTLTTLAATGVTAAAVLSRIAVSLDLAEPGEPVTLSDLLPRFDPARLPREPWVVRVEP